MWKKIHWRRYLTYAIVAAILYVIPVIFFLKRANYSDAWLLYLGNFLFLFVVTAFLFAFNKQRQQNATTVSMLTAGHITAIMGIIIACIFCTALVFAFNATAHKVLADAPANTVKDSSGGMGFMLFANAIFGNIVAGSSASIIFPFVLKRNQTKEVGTRKQDEL